MLDQGRLAKEMHFLTTRAASLLKRMDPDLQQEQMQEATRNLRAADLLSGKIPQEAGLPFAQALFETNTELQAAVKAAAPLALENALKAESLTEMVNALIPQAPRE